MPPSDRKYLETRIKTAPPEELTLIIYDVLIQCSSKAATKLRETPGDIQGIHDELRRAQMAVATLMGSLNFEIGGELAKSLFRMYEFWHRELVAANLQKSAARIERLMPDFKSLRETWAEANAKYRAMQRPEAAPAKVEGGGFVAVG